MILPNNRMKKNPSTPATECALDGTQSACGLPSHAVIDMAKAAVKHSDAEWQQRLTPLQYHVARQQGTEPPLPQCLLGPSRRRRLFFGLQRHAPF